MLFVWGPKVYSCQPPADLIWRGTDCSSWAPNCWRASKESRGAEKEGRGRKVEEKCLILSFPCLWCLWLIFQHFSAIQLCLQTWGGVKTHTHIYTTSCWEDGVWGMLQLPLFFFFWMKNKVSDRQVDVKLGKYWWLLDHFISHPRTSFLQMGEPVYASGTSISSSLAFLFIFIFAKFNLES